MINLKVNSSSIPNSKFPVILNPTKFLKDVLPKTLSKRPSDLLRPPTKIVGPIFEGDQTFQVQSMFKAKRQIHFPMRALFIRDKFLNPKPPNPSPVQTTSHYTKWAFFSRAPPPQRKFLRNFSNLLATIMGILTIDI